MKSLKSPKSSLLKKVAICAIVVCMKAAIVSANQVNFEIIEVDADGGASAPPKPVKPEEHELELIDLPEVIDAPITEKPKDVGNEEPELEIIIDPPDREKPIEPELEVNPAPEESEKTVGDVTHFAETTELSTECRDKCKNFWCDCYLPFCVLGLGLGLVDPTLVDVDSTSGDADGTSPDDGGEDCPCNPDEMAVCRELCGPIVENQGLSDSETNTFLSNYFGECNNTGSFAPSISSVPTQSPTMTGSFAPSISSVPTQSPTMSVSPTLSSAPTIDCKCCNCTHTSGCSPGKSNIIGGRS